MPLAANLVMLAVYGQVALTLALLFMTGKRRINALKDKKTTVAEIALNSMAWPEDALKAANSYKNQFEVPVLFYIVCLMFMGFSNPDMIVAALALLFTLSRYIHAFIHINSNHVIKRARAFFASALLVGLMWLYLLYSHILSLLG